MGNCTGKSSIAPPPPVVLAKPVKWAYKEDSATIICPFNAFLYNNGFLIPDADGYRVCARGSYGCVGARRNTMHTL